MGKLDALAGAGEDHPVLADHVAAARARQSRYRPRGAGRYRRRGCVTPRSLQRDLAAFGGGLAEHQRGAGRRVALVAVVHLQDLDIEFRAERCGDLRGEHGEQIDAEAHIAGLDDGGMTGGGLDLGLVGGREAGRADDMDDARLRRQRGERDRRACGEVKSSTPSTSAKTGSGSSVMAMPSGSSPATSPMSRPTAGEPLASMPPATAQPGRGNDPGQRLAHAPGGAKHGDLHVAHGQGTIKRA